MGYKRGHEIDRNDKGKKRYEDRTALLGVPLLKGWDKDKKPGKESEKKLLKR